MGRFASAGQKATFYLIRKQNRLRNVLAAPLSTSFDGDRNTSLNRNLYEELARLEILARQMQITSSRAESYLSASFVK